MTATSSRLLALVTFLAGCQADSTSHEEGPGKPIAFLDRQNVQCGNKALTQFRFSSSLVENKVWYDYTCQEIGPTSCQSYQTSCNDGANLLKLEFLDRHDVICPVNSALAGFRLLTKCGDQSNNFLYTYNCCTVKRNNCVSQKTACQELVDKPIGFLDRHDVRCPAGKVMTQEKVERCWPDTATGKKL